MPVAAAKKKGLAADKKEAYHYSGRLFFDVSIPPLLTSSKKSANKEKSRAKSVCGLESMGRCEDEVRRMQIGPRAVTDNGHKVITLKDIQDDVCKAFDCEGKDVVCPGKSKKVNTKPLQERAQCVKDRCNVKPTRVNIKDAADNTEYICKANAKDIKCTIKPQQDDIKENAGNAEDIKNKETKPVQGNIKDNAENIRCNNAKPVQCYRKGVGDNVKGKANATNNRKQIKKDCKCEKFLKALEKEMKKKEKADQKEREKMKAMEERAQREKEREREKERLRVEREQREREKERERREKELCKITNSKAKCNSKKNPSLVDIRKSVEANCGKCCLLLELYLKETCKFYTCMYCRKDAGPSHFQETFCQLVRTLACMSKDFYQFLRYFYNLLFV